VARLLLIDDDIAEISAVKRVLARSGRAPLLATNASDARASISQNRPDLLLVGVGCENGEALALAHRLEEDEATRGIPLILLGTSDQAPAHAVQLPRPIDPAVLGAQVRALLGDGQATAPSRRPTSR
jgi:PleD family two-component response regulator